jgi:archaellum component FlaC
MRKCGQCKRLLDEQEFIKNGKDHKMCGKCRDYHKEHSKKYRIKNPEQNHKNAQNYRKYNIDKIRKTDREWKQKYREEHPEEYKEYRNKYNEEHKSEIKAFDKNRMLNRPEYFLFSSARKRARERGLEFDITEQDVKELLDTTQLCPLRKVLFDRGNEGKPIDNSRSLDRIDSSRGYTNDNIQIISYRANVIKNDLSLMSFRSIVMGFKAFVLQEHPIDNETVKYLLNNRTKQIIDGNREKDLYRLINIEKWLTNSARKRARKNNIEINIDADYIRSIWPLDNKCPIIHDTFIFGKDVVSDYSATIDRIDNNKGYIKGNVRIIANKANVVKSKATLEELEFILKNWEEMEK